MKYWWDNLDDDEKMTAFALGGIALAILAITLFFAIPRNEQNEPECDLPTSIQDPKIGDKIRQIGHSEKYTVTGEIDGKTKTLTLTKNQWSDLQDNATIYYKRRPLSSEIKDMQIGK